MASLYSSISHTRLVLLLAASILLMLAGAGSAVMAANAEAERAGGVTLAAEQHHRDPTLVLTLGKAEVVDIEGDVSDILVANPSVVDVQALQSNRLYMVGSEIGDTNIIALDAAGNIIRRMNIHVRIDELTLQRAINDLFPKESVNVKTAGNQLLLAGSVSTPSVASKVRDLALRFTGSGQDSIVNMMDVQGKEQVMLQVKIMEVSRSLIRELGVRSELPNLSNSAAAATSNLGGVVSGRTTTGTLLGDAAQESVFSRALGADVLGSFLLPGGGVTEDPFGSLTLFNEDIAPFLLTIDALDQNGLVKTLAEPNLTALSGEEAGFLAGGEFPVPSGRDSEGNIEISFRPFGVSLNFRPVVMSEDRISMELETEVSAVSREQSVTLDGLDVPGRDVRRANTNVELPSGGSLMIAGLIQSETLDSLEGLPGVIDLPIIGDLMKSKSFRRAESELVILVTAYLVKPFADKEKAELIQQKNNVQHLARAFAANVRRTFGELKLTGLLDDETGYGYLLK